MDIQMERKELADRYLRLFQIEKNTLVSIMSMACVQLFQRFKG